MKVLITGCCGFIGLHYARNLLKKKIYVIGIDNINNYYSQALKLNRLKELKKFRNFKFKKIDITNYKKLHNIFKKNKISCVIHLAAQAGVRLSFQKPEVYFNNNVSGFFNILNLCKIYSIKKLIYASSSSVYGDSKKKILSENDRTDLQVSFYAATKKMNEICSNVYAKKFNMDIIGIRFFTVYGPYGRPDMAYFKFLNNLYKNKPIDVYNYGKHSRDFSYIDDVVHALYKIQRLNPQKRHIVYNIGSGNPQKLLKLINIIEKLTGKKFIINYTQKQTGDVKNTFANINSLRKQINFKTKTNLKNGLNNFVNWYVDYYKINKSN